MQVSQGQVHLVDLGMSLVVVAWPARYLEPIGLDCGQEDLMGSPIGFEQLW